MDICIQEITIDNIPINKIKIDILTLIFNNSAYFRVRYNPNSIYEPKPSYINIEGDEYRNWENDDVYIINLICSKLNLTPLQPDYLHQSDPSILDPISYPIDPVIYPIEPEVIPNIEPTEPIIYPEGYPY
jgi:hypothetical protein